VLILGRILGNVAPAKRDYGEWLVVSVGLAVFALSVRSDQAGLSAGSAWGPASDGSGGVAEGGGLTSPAGLLLLGVYTVCDAFTWQWMARLYRTFSVDQYTVNGWSGARNPNIDRAALRSGACPHSFRVSRCAPRRGQVMLWLNAVQLVGVGAGLVLSGEGKNSVAFLTHAENAPCCRLIVFLSVLAAFSQVRLLPVLLPA